ncbi:hypothetical protein IQ265_18335 [Nodosilinea sp. LEGE 06152]|uniref:hypothetical protein n=1 Tax=Nodosilinea sp. LEGE 06152 TaxID=2777966 RepID=UPI00188013CC|nr:hypothetical protein [Nodosilinea sp. LEGE 06152]MBE9158776.1 hypothetical protein [Nodosilinea sp. LEGE 06152]
MDGPFPQGMLKSELLNRLAINLDTAEEFGSIAELWVNGRTHQVQGIGCSAGGLLHRQSRRFLWSQIGSIGRDGVVVKAGAQIAAIDEHLQDCLPLGVIELWSDHGDRTGQLTDYRFDPATGNILQYLFIPEEGCGLAPGLYALDPIAVISTGRRRMMAEDAALRSARLIQAGIPQPPEPTTPRSPFERIPLDRIPLDRVPDPRQSWDAAVKTTRQAQQQVNDRLQDQRQKLGAEAQDRRQKLQAEAQDKLGGLLGNVKKRTRHLRKQLREAVTDATAGLPSGPNLRDDNVPTIDVNAMELWPEDDLAPKRPPYRPPNYPQSRPDRDDRTDGRPPRR